MLLQLAHEIGELPQQDRVCQGELECPDAHHIGQRAERHLDEEALEACHILDWDFVDFFEQALDQFYEFGSGLACFVPHDELADEAG